MTNNVEHLSMCNSCIFSDEMFSNCFFYKLSPEVFCKYSSQSIWLALSYNIILNIRVKKEKFN